MIWICKVLYVFSCLMLSKFGHIICVVYVENGKSLVLNPDIKGMPEDILWTFNENKLSERDLSEFQDYGQFVNRTEIDISTGHLTVHNMTNIDTGSYKAIIQIDGKLQYFGDFVNVIDGVPEPQVTCELNRTSESRLLSCSVSAGIPVKFHWTGPNVLQFSQALEINKDEPSESVFICTVKNQVSQKNISIILTDCIKDGENHQMIIILVSISVFCVLLGALIIYFIYFRREKKEDTEATAHLLTKNHCKPLKADVNHKIINGNDDEQTISGDKECLHNDAEANIITKDIESNTDEYISEEDPKTEDVQDKSKSATQLKNIISKQKGDGHVPNEEQNTAQKIKEDEDPKIEDVQDKSESETGENQTVINEDEEQKIKEEEDPKTEDVQDKSESATQLKNNTSKQKGDGHVPNEEQNTAQKIKEDEDLCFRNNEGAVRTQDNKSNTDGNLSDKPRKTEEIQDQSEQRHESKYSEEVKNEEQEINKDRNKSVNTGEQKYRTKTDPQSDEHDNQQELDSDHQTQPIPDPAKEGFKCIREEHKENFEEEDKGGEESNTGKKESTNNSNSATCKQMTVKKLKEIYENNSQTPGPKSS